MMRPFVSFAWKVLSLLIALLLVLSIAITSIWMSQTEANLERRQAQIRTQATSQYHQLNQLTQKRLELWVESFMHLSGAQSASMQDIATTLETETEFLKTTWEVDDVWLFDPQQSLTYSSSNTLPDAIQQARNTTIESLSPYASVMCSNQCQHVLAVPVLVGQSNTASIVMTTSFSETLAFLSQTNQARVAVAAAPVDVERPQYSLLSQVSEDTRTFFEQTLTELHNDEAQQSLLIDGSIVQLADSTVMLNVIDLDTSDNMHFAILLAHDLSELVTSHQKYQQAVLVFAVALFSVFGLVVFVVLNGYRRRLMTLADALPLLAKHKFDAFKRFHIPRSRLFADEIDHVRQAANSLGKELQTLDKQVASHTRELEKIAMYDLLTSLPNRNMLNFQLDKVLAQSRRDGSLIAILFLDLDDFKKVNDAYGHTAGDALLREAAKRLKRIVRQNDLVCRFGGDEFVILLTQLHSKQDLIVIAEKLLSEFHTELLVESRRFHVSTSIGIALCQAGQASSDEMISQADIAMYEAKQQGSSSYRIYDVSMSERVLRKIELENEARDSLLNGHFSLALQPQVEISNGHLVGFEALLRWSHPEKGMISPAEFIPILENTEFMVSLDYWVLDRCIQLLQQFDQRGYPTLRLAVNLSASQFLDPNLGNYLQQKCEEYGQIATRIELELTETTLIKDMQRAMAVMRQLRDMGFTISIDDFGTGYSSLNYLKTMPADTIKIDRCFVSGMLSSAADRQIVYSTISMVKNLGMKTVAEGIEESEELKLLEDFECDLAQGYFIAKPIAEKDVWQELECHFADGRWRYQGRVAAVVSN